MKKNIKKNVFLTLLCLSLILSGINWPQALSVYAQDTQPVNEIVKSAELYSAGAQTSIQLSDSEDNASTCVYPDKVNSVNLRIYPNGEYENYYVKVYHKNEGTGEWETATSLRQKLSKSSDAQGNKYAQISFALKAVKKYVETGKKHTFKLEFFEDSKCEKLVESNTKYFCLIRSMTLSEITATDTNGQSLVVREQDNNRYVIACPYDTLNLVCTAKTPAYARIKVNEADVGSSSAYNVDLTKYTENVNGQKEIPVNVAYTGAEGTGQGTEYTLLVEKTDYTPNVKASYSGATPEEEDIGFYNTKKKISCDKDSKITMSVEATAPEGSNLTYQWYLCSKSGEDHAIKAVEDATESTYTVPTGYVSETVYSCIVTNTVNGATFTAESEHCLFSVKPTYASPAVIVSQPETVEVLCGQKGEQAKIEAMSNDWGAVLTYQWYRTDKNDSKDGTAIANGNAASVVIDATEAGTYYYYCEVKSSLKKEDGTTDVSNAVVSKPIQIVIKDTSDYFEGKGTRTEPFMIKEAKDFETVRTLVAAGNSLGGTYFKMDCETKEITLPSNWAMIGTLKDGFTETSSGVGVSPFSGHLDGNGCTIKIEKGGKPLFRYVRDASISNLKIYGEQIDGAGLVDEYFIDYGEDGNYSTGVPDTVTVDNVTLLSGTSTKKSGFIHGNASGKNDIVISNCTVEENVTIGYDKTVDAIGSFAGFLNGKIINCKSAAEIYGGDYVGGIAGAKGQSMGICSVLNCQFTGKIYATGNYVGGMIGSGYDGKGTAPNTPVVSVQNCVVSGSIEGKNNIGGILGGEPDCEDCWANGAGSVINNVFCGTVSATDTDAAVGAIVGFLKSYNTNQTVDNNYFTESCGAANGIGRVEIIHDADFDITKTGTAVLEQAMKDGTVVGELNKSETSYKNWIQGTSYPTHSEDAVLYAIELSGEYKTQYKTGDSFSTEGMVITGTLSDGSTRTIDLSDNALEFTGYNLNQRGVQTVTVTYGVAKTSYEVTVLYDSSQVKDIVAYFTVLGDDVHGEPTEATGTHTLKSGNLKQWVGRTEVKIDNNTTVYDVMKKVLEANNITWQESNSRGTAYIESLTKDGVTLGEFTNGSLSGWMYTLNGTHPNLAVAEQFLNDGDNIVFHYTDDYTKEEGSEHWSSDTKTEETKTTVVTDDKSGSTATTAPTETKVTEKTNADGTKEKTATVTVSDDNQTEIIKQAADKKSSDIVLDAAASDTDGADNVQLQINVSFVRDISEKTEATLTVSTGNGTVSLDRDTIKTVLDEAKGSVVTIDVNKVANPGELQKKAAGTNGQILSLTVKSGDKVISDFKTGKVTVTVAINAALQDKRVAAIRIAEDGKIEQLPGKNREVNGKKCYEFTTSHFSDFALVDADELGLDTEDKTDVKELVSKLTPVARSAKTSKKNVKVTVSLDKQDREIISELKAAGYTVKYKYYRSVKKASKYTALKTKSTGTFVNTKGKRGTKYYYKVKAVVYDRNKVVAQSALSQCKYAARTWSK